MLCHWRPNTRRASPFASRCTMRRLIDTYLERLNSAYRGRAFFAGLKARLLALLTVLVLAFVPLNIAKTLWYHPPETVPRVALNLFAGAAGVICLRFLFRGKLEQAGNGFALTLVLGVHATVLFFAATTRALQPLGVGIQLFAFDLVFILFAVVFASRLVATAVFALIAVDHVCYHHFMLQGGALPVGPVPRRHPPAGGSGHNGDDLPAGNGPHADDRGRQQGSEQSFRQTQRHQREPGEDGGRAHARPRVATGRQAIARIARKASFSPT